jgi:hypothetical protein
LSGCRSTMQPCVVYTQSFNACSQSICGSGRSDMNPTKIKVPYKAYIIGKLYPDSKGVYTLKRIDITSEGPFHLTHVGDGAAYVELAPPHEGRDFGEALDSARKYIATPHFQRMYGPTLRRQRSRQLVKGR